LNAEAGSFQIDQEVNIHPVDGVLHVVIEADTFEHLQLLHGDPKEAIVNFVENDFSDAPLKTLNPGLKSLVPEEKMTTWIEPRPQLMFGKGRNSAGYYSGPIFYNGSGVFTRSVYSIVITQPYWSGHPAIDIDTY
jgi:hypothetical protein